MRRLLDKIKSNLIVAIPIMMVLGLGYGLLFPQFSLKLLVLPFTFLMVYPMMVTLKLKKVIEGGDWKTQILTQLINFAVIPFLSYAIAILFFPDSPYIILGIVMIGVIPTSGMTISWTGIAKGNMEAAIKMTVIGLILGAFTVPVYLQALVGKDISLNTAAIFRQIIVIAIIPMILGFLTQQFLVKKYGMERFRKNIAPVFPAVSVLGVLGIVFIAISLKASAIIFSPELLLQIVFPLLLLYTAYYTISTIVGRIFLNRRDGIALVYGSVMRNLSIALAISINAFGSEGSMAALVIAIAFVIQVQSAAWYAKMANLFFKTTKTVNNTPEIASNS